MTKAKSLSCNQLCLLGAGFAGAHAHARTHSHTWHAHAETHARTRTHATDARAHTKHARTSAHVALCRPARHATDPLLGRDPKPVIPTPCWGCTHLRGCGGGGCAGVPACFACSPRRFRPPQAAPALPVGPSLAPVSVCRACLGCGPWRRGSPGGARASHAYEVARSIGTHNFQIELK